MRYFLLIFSLGILLTGCGSSKKAVAVSNKKLADEERILFKESDRIFNDFKRAYAKNLNVYTIQYIETYKNVAIEKMIEYRIPASITLAQGILESGNGRSELTRKANNHFGIKCHKDWKGKSVRYDDDRRRECFRKYSNPEGSFNDHSLFLTTRKRYAFLFDLRPDDYKAWARGLKKAGYATDRRYPKKLIGIIEDYHLYDFDKLVMKKKKYLKASKKGRKTEPVVVQNSSGASKTDNRSSYSSYRKYVIVNTGDTLYSIATAHRLSVDRLKKINKLTGNHIRVGQKLYVE